MQNDFFEGIHFESVEDFLEKRDSFLFLLDGVEDGVSVIAPDLTLLYVNDPMRRWYGIDSNFPNEKCYKLYHGLEDPCADCPALKSMRENTGKGELEKEDQDNAECGTIQLNKYIIRNSQGEAVLIIGLTKDITAQKAIEKQVDDLKEEFELLKRQNELLLENMKLRERQFDELNETIQENLEQYVRPSLEHLKKKVDEKDVDAVASVIDSVVYPVTKKRISRLKELSPREMQVAALIRDGHSSKQIAEKLYISKKAVDFHRANIRKKLRLKPNDNLQRYLGDHM